MKSTLLKFLAKSSLAIACLLMSANIYGQLTPACSPNYTSGSFNWNIEEITVGSFTQSISYNTHDYTDDSFDVTAGETNSISLTSNGFCSVGIAADFNNDGDFDDNGEVMQIAEYQPSGTYTYTFDFTVPGSTLTGSYRFRAWNIGANSTGGDPAGSPCGTYGYGSWFDVTINVTNNAACQPPSNVQVSDVGSTTAEINWDASISTPSAYQWELYQAGSDPETSTPEASGTATETNASITGLAPSTEYEFYVQSYCGASELSLPTIPADFFTLCDGTPTAGTPITDATSVCGDDNFTITIDSLATTGPGIEYQWQSSPAGENNWTDIDGETASSYSTTQDEATDYRYVVTCTGSGQSTNSEAVSIEQNAPNECYCTPGNTGTNYGDIVTNVTFAGINNDSPEGEDVNGYADYTESVEPGIIFPQLTYDFSAHTGNGGTEYVGMWIDYNANGVFEESEHTFIGSGNNTTVSAEITVPSDATIGMTRMRVRVKYYSEAGADNPCGGYSYGETEDYAIEIVALEECDASPEPGMTIASTDSICAGASMINLSLEDNYIAYSGIDYQWQVNNDGDWVDLENDTNMTATVSPMENSMYRAVLTCSNSGSEGMSEAVQIEALPLPAVSVSPSSFAICEGGSAVLTATGATEYNWAPEGGLTATTGASVQASPENATQYTVTGTDEQGCVNTATVSVSPIDQIQVSAETAVDGFCEPGELVAISLGGVPEGISGGGNWSYQWMDADSNEVQSFSPISNYSTTPSEDGYYSYFVNMVASSCSNDTIYNAAEINFTVGFGAEGESSLINCNRPLGSIALSNSFGIVSDSIFFENDFSVPLDQMEGDSIGIFQDAHLEDGRLVLTNSSTGATGGASIFNYPPSGFAGMDVSFDLTADQPINNYGTGGADGLAYSFGDDLETAGLFSLQNGTGTKLRLSFDAADNGSNSPKGIYLIYGFEGTGNVPNDDPAVYGYSSNMSWKIQTDVPVSLHIDKFGKATVTVNGVTIFNQVQLPQEFIDANKSNWFSRFTAATGGDAMRQAVDNVQISYSSLQYGVTTDQSNPPAEWQMNTSFDSLEVGTYYVWMGNSDQACEKLVGTYEISDISPVVDLSTPVNICAGDSAVLDAENTGATYMWNTGDTTQTITVTEEGNYAVLVTDTASCTDLGSAAVNVTPPSSVDGITATAMEDGYLFTAINPNATDTYFWEFGDGETETTPIPTVMHSYANSGNYVVTVTVSSAFGCADGTASGSFDITTGISEIAENAGISIYPNPASEMLYLDNPGEAQIESIDILDATGKRVKQVVPSNNSLVRVNINSLENGMYILMINTDEVVYHSRFVVTK